MTVHDRPITNRPIMHSHCSNRLLGGFAGLKILGDNYELDKKYLH